MAIYHTIVILKAGPLNVSQSNLASGTVHWILYRWPYNLSCIIRLPKCVLQGWEDKADDACGFSSCVIYSWVRTSRGQRAWLFSN